MTVLDPVPSVHMLRTNLSAYIAAADEDGTVTTITRDGKPVAAVIPLFMLEKLEQWEDEELSRRADKTLAEYDGAV